MISFIYLLLSTILALKASAEFTNSSFSGSTTSNTHIYDYTWIYRSAFSCVNDCGPCLTASYNCYNTVCQYGDDVRTFSTPQPTPQPTSSPDRTCFTGDFVTPSPPVSPSSAELTYDWTFDSSSCSTPCGPCSSNVFYCQDTICSRSGLPVTVTQTSPFEETYTFSSDESSCSGFVHPPTRSSGILWPYSYTLVSDYSCTLPCGPCSHSIINCYDTVCTLDDGYTYTYPGLSMQDVYTLSTPISCPYVTKTTYSQGSSGYSPSTSSSSASGSSSSGSGYSPSTSSSSAFGSSSSGSGYSPSTSSSSASGSSSSGSGYIPSTSSSSASGSSSSGSGYIPSTSSSSASGSSSSGSEYIPSTSSTSVLLTSSSSSQSPLSGSGLTSKTSSITSTSSFINWTTTTVISTETLTLTCSDVVCSCSETSIIVPSSVVPSSVVSATTLPYVSDKTTKWVTSTIIGTETVFLSCDNTKCACSEVVTITVPESEIPDKTIWTTITVIEVETITIGCSKTICECQPFTIAVSATAVPTPSTATETTVATPEVVTVTKPETITLSSCNKISCTFYTTTISSGVIPDTFTFCDKINCYEITTAPTTSEKPSSLSLVTTEGKTITVTCYNNVCSGSGFTTTTTKVPNYSSYQSSYSSRNIIKYSSGVITSPTTFLSTQCHFYTCKTYAISCDFNSCNTELTSSGSKYSSYLSESSSSITSISSIETTGEAASTESSTVTENKLTKEEAYVGKLKGSLKNDSSSSVEAVSVSTAGSNGALLGVGSALTFVFAFLLSWLVL